MAKQPGSKRIAKAMAAVNCHRVTKFIIALRTAFENGGATSLDDLFDAFRMSLSFWH